MRTCSLLAFGGAGPLHAADLARELGIMEVIVPPLAGVFSALGILLSEIKLDFSQSILKPLGETALNTIEDILKGFKKKAWQSLQRQGLLQGKGKNSRAILTPFVDVRYKGQSFSPIMRELTSKRAFRAPIRPDMGISGFSIQEFFQFEFEIIFSIPSSQGKNSTFSLFILY